MPRVELDVDTTVPPDRVRAALLDFSDRRPVIWPSLYPGLYEVYAVGETTADVKEGSKVPGGVIWAREHYDWSSPDLVTWTVRESNFCTPGSFVSARITPRDGGSRIHVVWNRTAANLAARILFQLIRLSGGKPVADSIRKAMARLEREPAA